MPGRPPWRTRAGLDVAAAVALSLLAPLAVFQLPEGSVLRAIVGAVVLLLVPGYLLLQATAPQERRVHHWAASIGFSLPLIGLATLATVGLPGGMTVGNIVLVQAVLAVVLGASALWRRRTLVQADAPTPQAVQEDSHAGVGESRPPRPSPWGEHPTYDVAATPVAASPAPVDGLKAPLEAERP